MSEVTAHLATASIAGYVIDVCEIADELGHGYRTSIRSRATTVSKAHTFSTFDSGTETEARKRANMAFVNLRNGNTDRADQKAIYVQAMPAR